MTPEEFVDILRSHDRFIRGVPDGQRADLSFADLSNLRLPNINLQQANLTGVNLTNTVLTKSDFGSAELLCAIMPNTESEGSNFAVVVPICGAS